MKRLVLALILLLAEASTASSTDVFDAPCKKYGVPKALVQAIALQESGGNPWAVNVAGKTFQASSKDEALSIIKKYDVRSYDVGLMQINSQWLRKFQISPETALEPRNNVLIGVWVLANSIRQHGLSWKAVGAYHSPTPERQRRYVRSVAKHLNRICRTQ